MAHYESSTPIRRSKHHARISRMFLVALSAAGLVGLIGAARGATTPSSGPAQAWVDAVRKDAPVPKKGACLDVRYEGDLDLEGHYRRPGQTLRYHSTRRFLSDGRGAVRLDWTTWMEGDSVGAPESCLVVDGAAYHRDDPTKPWEILSGARGDRAVLQARSGLPWEFLGQKIPKSATTMNVTSGGAEVHRITLPVVGVRHRTLAIQGGRL